MRKTNSFLQILFLLPLALPANAEREVRIGAMAELSGQFAKLGADCRKGYQLAEHLYAPPKSELGATVIITDNGGDAKTGISEFQRLVAAEGAEVIITTRSPVGLAINPLSVRSKIPVVGIIAHPAFTKDNPYALRVFPSTLAEGGALAKEVQKQKLAQVATITLEDDYFLGLTEAFVTSLGQQNIVFSEAIPASETDLGPIITRLLAKQPDSILVNVGPGQLPALLKRIAENRFNGQIFSNFIVAIPDVQHAAGSAADGVVYVQSDFDKPAYRQKLLELFEDESSSPIGYSCFVGLATILQTFSDFQMMTNDDSTTNSAFGEMLIKTENVRVLGEVIRFENREAQIPLVALRVAPAKK